MLIQLPFPSTKLFFSFAMLFGSYAVNSQIEVTPADIPPFTPENLITNVFLGEGLEVLNITYSGVPAAVGYFSNGTNDVGIDRGIVMSSGNASSAATANTSNSTSGTTSGSSIPDPDLSAIANANIFDVARYEITFIPISDTLRFRFVFASEEYPEYACTNFNDAFGFFISGPGINGTFSNNGENIALVPDPADPSGFTFTDVPVTINNVNNEGVDVAGGCLYDYNMYYNDNAGSLTMTYDAYLDVFTAQAVVIPCSTYTIKLAICDRGDSVFDSAVFLEAKSFGTGSLDVQVATVSLDGTITEECAGAEISFCLPTPTEADFIIDYNIIGTAQQGIDFPAFPDTLFIPAGDSCVSLFVDAFEDGIPEGVETIGIDIQRDPCNRDTFWIFIRDNELVAPDLGPDTTICRGEGVALDGTLPIQLPAPPSFSSDAQVSFSSNNSPQFSDINVFGVQPFTLSEGVIQSICIDKLTHAWMDDVDLYLISPGGQFIELSTDNGADGGNLSFPDSLINTCFTIDATTPINFPGPFAPPSALPLSGNWQPEGVWSDLWDGEYPVNGTWRLQLFDDTQGFGGTLESWTITFEPLYQISYQWFPAKGLSCSDCPDPFATPDTTTTYYLEASDSYGCAVYDTITITVLDVLPAPEVSCELTADTAIQVSWSSLADATSYEVNIDNTGWVPVNAGPDTLSYQIGGLTYDQCIDIEVRAIALCDGLIDSLTCCTPACDPASVAIINASNPSCLNGNDGSFQLEATGLNPPFTYTIPALGNSNTNGFFEGLEAGPYQVVVVDAVNCPATINVVVKSPDALMPSPYVINSISCNAGNDGIIGIEMSGGTGPYTYLWNTGSTDSLLSDLPIGMYMVTVTDANGCVAVDSIELTEAAALSLNPVGTTLLCNGDENGTISATPSGGNAPYVWQWDSLSGGLTDSIITGLSAGNYGVTVSDVNGCTTEAIVVVAEPEAIDLTTGFIPPKCYTSGNGKAFVHAEGGAGSYSYKWNDIGNQATDTAYNVKAGNYRVIVTDANACRDTAFVQVIPPDSLSTLTLVEPTSCFDSEDGAISFSSSGGTEPYSFNWFDGVQTDSFRTDLAAGVYTITLTDANNCKKVISPIVSAPLPLEVEVMTQPVACFQGDEGSAEAVVSGGTGNWSYTWSGLSDTVNQISGLSAGIYQLTVSDENDCTIIDTFSIANAEAIQLSVSVMDANCHGENTGSAEAMPIGGAGNWAFNWSNGSNQQEASNLSAGTYFLTVTDGNNCKIKDTIQVGQPPALLNGLSLTNISCNGEEDGTANSMPVGGIPPYNISWSNNQTGPNANDLEPGSHQVTIVDGNGCEFIDTFQLTEPQVLTLSEVLVTSVSCNAGADGKIQVMANGGTAPYFYAWSAPGIGNSTIASNLSAASYSVTVTDANDCEAMLTIEITEPDALEGTFNVNDAACFGVASGDIDISVSGGTIPYTFNWSNNENTEDLSDILAGNYSLTITDSKACTTILNMTVDQPDNVTVNYQIDQVDCFGNAAGAINTQVTGGTQPYTYNWSGPDNYQSADPNIADLFAGIYQLVIVDANGCNYVQQEVEVQQPDDAVTTSIPIPDKICEGAADGNAVVVVEGGTGPYSYLWSNGQLTPDASGLNEGTYTVTVTDSQDCAWEDMVEIVSYGVMSSTLEQQAALCHNGEDGEASVVTVFYDGLAQPLNDFTYQWNSQPIQTSAKAIGLQADKTYEVTITNVAGCTSTESIKIDNPDLLTVNLQEAVNVTCYGGADGTAAVSGNGGTGNLYYFWGANAGSVTGTQAVNLSAGNYVVTVVDENNCLAYTEIQINQPNQLELTDYKVKNVDCYGEATGTIAVDMQGGVSPYSYAWSNGMSGLAIANLSAGTYQLTVTDKNGCTLQWNKMVSQPDSPVTGSLQADPVSCFGKKDGRITIEAIGGTPPFTYSVDGNNYNGSSVQIGLPAGYYPGIFVEDSKGCGYFIGSIDVPSPEQVQVDLGPDIELEYGDSALLIPDIFFAFEPVSYYWNPQDSSCQNPVDCRSLSIQPEYTSTVNLEIIDNNGCVAEDDILIYIRQTRGVYVPTAFTPNGDEANNLLVVRGKPGIKVKTFRIFDRWGENVFEAADFEVNNPLFGWDGTFRTKELSSGVFVWYAEVEYPDGFVEIYKGSTHLFR